MEIFQGLDNKKQSRNFLHMEDFIKHLRNYNLYLGHQEDASIFLRKYLDYLKNSLKKTTESS